MASDEEPPVKRRRLSNDVAAEPSEPAAHSVNTTRSQQPAGDASDDQIAKEIKAGITSFVHPDAPGFSGVLKQRYTDFLVNEILPDGRVLHLTNTSVPQRKTTQVEAYRPSNTQSVASASLEGAGKQNNAEDNPGESEGIEQNTANGINEDANASAQITKEDNESLVEMFSQGTADKIIALYESILKHPTWKPKDFNSITSAVITEKEQRTQAHQLIRRVFTSRLETKTSENDTILITASPRGAAARGGAANHNVPRIKNKQGWQELGGDYTHFTLYKENKDTMEAIFFLASQLKVGVKHFQFGGTKDRRAVTVQRCSAYRIHAGQLAAVGRSLRGSKIGDYGYHPEGLELGDLGGNEFVITLRDCRFQDEAGLNIDGRVALAEKVLTDSVRAFKQGGFLNYYGLQRFGSFATSTDEVGLKLLQSNLSGAVADILTFNPAALENDGTALISSDDRARAEAIQLWNTTKNSEKALEKLPRKFSAESNIIRFLGLRNRKTGAYSNLTDYQGALQTIPRNLRLMYVHAYQSLVWNIIVGKRWELYGPQVAEGDLVLVSEHVSKLGSAPATQPTVDDEGEPIVLASASNGAAASTESPYEQARALSAAEAASGAYSIFDIVLPLPGYDVIYPPNEVGAEYKTFMASERGGGLNPYDMRRSWKDLSLSGSYRKVLARPGPDMAFEVKSYEKAEDQLVETDWERLKRKEGEGEGRGEVAAAAEAGMSTVADKSEAVDAVTAPQTEKKLAVILRMQLGPSQYATMALRELMKNGGVQTYKPDFGGGR